MERLRADAAGQLHEGVNPLLKRWQIRFEYRVIGVQGELEVVIQPALSQLVQILQYGSRVLGPEADSNHILRFQAEAGHLGAVERVDPVEVPFPDPSHEPFSIKGLYVGASAG